jgi:eukaryotic-like serine/threonine-protein kinase
MATDVGSDELSDTAGGEHNQLQRLGKYRIEKRIGAGGMGTVFLAVDTDLNRTVALKVLPKDRAANPVLVRRFKAEGQAAAQMEHPNIVRVFEAGEADGFLYMALEYVEGIDVYELVERRGVIPVKRSTDIIRQTTLALQHAHERGIVHRDIKPSNLLIKRDGSVKLADMGLARSVDETLETNITRAGTTVGTVDYMSPEQARNSKAADVRSDIYSLGCTWYHMLTGHPPFPDGGMTNKLQAHAISTRPDPRAENDRVPEGIVAVIQRMMACKPDDRYQTPQELLDDLEATGKMHRTVDESALAALADEGTAAQHVEADAEPVVRVGDIDQFDLSSLRESGEYETSEPPAESSRPAAKPGRGRETREKKQGQRARTTSAGTEAPTHDEAAVPDGRRAFGPLEPETPGRQQAAARRTPPAEEEPRAEQSKRKSAKQKPDRTPSGRRSRRGTATTKGAAASEQPLAGPSQPVDGSTRGVDLEKLKVVIPVALVIAALVGIGYALMRGGDSLGVSPAINPYAGEKPQDEIGPAKVAASDTTEDNKPEQEPSPGGDAEPRQVSELPFPGAEDAARPAPDQLPLVPGWVDAFRRPAAQAQRSLVVRRRPDGSGQVATINDALDKLPREGGTVEIDGDGPFRLEAVTIRNRQRVRVQAAEGRQPVVQLIPPDDWKTGPLVSVQNTHLELQGLHFVLVDPGPTAGEVFGIHNGNLALRDCTITLESQAPGDVTALRLRGRGSERGEAPSGKCLLENVVIRGANLTSVALEGPAAELVAGNCLLVAGNAPAIVLGGAADGTSAGDDSLSRGVRLLATTVLSTQAAIVLRHEASSDSPVPTDVIIRRSLLGRPSGSGADDASAMTTLIGWPQGTGGLGAARIEGLTVQLDQSLLVGWSRLLRLADAAGATLEQIPAETDAWRKFWNQGLRSDAVLAESIPLAAPGGATPEAVHADLSAIARSSGQLPGCRPNEFPDQPAGLMEHVVAAVRKPYEPEGLGRGMKIAGEPVRFDLGLRRSLSRFLASDACPDATHVIAFGSGLKELEPLVIENKSIRLEFESTDKPLVIQPTAGREGAPPEEALITVRNGTLDLVAAPLKLPALSRRNYPRSTILLEDASLAVRYARIEGPLVDVDNAAPLIRIANAVATQQRYVLIESSFLVSLGPLVSGPVRWEALIARNSVLVTQTDAMTARVDAPDLSPAGIVLDHCTIATGGAAIRADVESSAADNTPALTLHARACIFAGPVGRPTDSSVVVAHSAGAAQNHSLRWWGSLNGYSERLSGSFIDGRSEPGDFARDWLANWGQGHEAQSLTGKTDVLFHKALPDLLRLVEPESFQLSNSATAATWGPGGTRLGATVDSIGPGAYRSEAGGTSRPQSPDTPGARRGRDDPGF